MSVVLILHIQPQNPIFSCLSNIKSVKCSSYMVLFLSIYKICSPLCNAINPAIMACRQFLHLRGLFIKVWESLNCEALEWKFWSHGGILALGISIISYLQPAWLVPLFDEGHLFWWQLRIKQDMRTEEDILA